MTKDLKVSSLKDVQAERNVREEGKAVELPSGLVFRLRRPNLSRMIEQDMIPQGLISVALKMSSGSTIETKDELKKSVQVVRTIIKEAVVEPADITDEDIAGMTDDDKGFIMIYVQKGVTDLRPFRNEQASPTPRPDMQTVSK